MDRTRAEGDFRRWVEKNRAGWVRLAGKALRDRHEAEDAVQDTLAAFWRRWPLSGVRDRDAYAERAVWLNALKRAKKRGRYVPFPDGKEPAAPDPAEPDMEEWDPVEMEKALDGLPNAQKVVVRLKYYGGMTFKEIGETLAISMNTAGSRCRYALEALRGALTANRRGP